MMIDEYHIEEQRLMEKIRRLEPDHPVLSQVFKSTFESVESMWTVESELESK